MSGTGTVTDERIGEELGVTTVRELVELLSKEVKGALAACPSSQTMMTSVAQDALLDLLGPIEHVREVLEDLAQLDESGMPKQRTEFAQPTPAPKRPVRLRSKSRSG